MDWLWLGRKKSEHFDWKKRLTKGTVGTVLKGGRLGLGQDRPALSRMYMAQSTNLSGLECSKASPHQVLKGRPKACQP